MAPELGGLVRSAEEIVSLHAMRRQSRGDYLGRMGEISRHYNNEVTVPLPELDANEKPAVANLLAQGIDQFSLRVASVMPDIDFPALRGNIPGSVEAARKRRLATLGWYDMNDMQIKMRRRARYQVAYASSPVSIHPVSLNPNDKRKIPFWRVRNPLSTFPSDVIDSENMEPADCIFEDARTLRWIKENYPAVAASLYLGKADDGDTFTILEYCDAEETVLVAVGAKRDARNAYAGDVQVGASQMVLDRVPNRAGICPVVIPTRIALDGVASKFEAMMGMFHRQAKLDSLNTIAVMRGVFPDEWLVPHPNSQGTQPRIVQNADGKSGVRGIIANGTITQMNPQPGQHSEQTLDRLERSARLSAGIPPEWGGESGSNIRTARRGESVMSNAVDPDIQEAQEIFAASQEAEIRRAIAIQKAYYGKEKTLFLLGMDGKVVGPPDYTPNDTFETDMVKVRYPLPGSDANQMAVMIGQKVGIGVMSTETAMEMDPLVRDPEMEMARIQAEGLRKALLSGLEQQAVGGQLDPQTMARIIKKVGDGRTTLEDAVDQVHREMQKEQADKQNEQPSGGDVSGVPQGMSGVPEASPEGQPGMAMPGSAGAPSLPPDQQGQPTVDAPSPGMDHLSQLLGALHNTSQAPA